MKDYVKTYDITRTDLINAKREDCVTREKLMLYNDERANILLTTDEIGNEGHIVMNQQNISTSENTHRNTYTLNGYTINIKYTKGKTLFQCMEKAIKNMNNRLKYKIL